MNSKNTAVTWLAFTWCVHTRIEVLERLYSKHWCLLSCFTEELFQSRAKLGYFQESCVRAVEWLSNILYGRRECFRVVPNRFTLKVRESSELIRGFSGGLVMS